MNAEMLVSSLAAMSRDATGEFDEEAMLRRLCDLALDVLAIDGAGVMGTDGSRVRFVHAHGAAVERVEELQGLLQQGPCHDAALSQCEVVIDDVRQGGRQRWPAWADAAVVNGLCSVAAVPLASRGRTWGVLDLYRYSPGGWSAEELAVARMLADVAVSYVVMASDREATRRAHTALAHRSMHDELTGLPNRSVLFDRLTHALVAAGRRRTVVAVFFLDVDRFKAINDTHGHAAGDAVLREVAARISGLLREEDTLARLSGDELVIVCEDLHREGAESVADHAAGVVKRIHRALDAPVIHGGTHISVSVSVGVAISTPGATAGDVVHRADGAMYHAKPASHTQTIDVRSSSEEGSRAAPRQA